MNSYKKSYLLLISFVSAMGGLLFGYDWVVIGGAKIFYEPFFDLAGSAALRQSPGKRLVVPVALWSVTAIDSR